MRPEGGAVSALGSRLGVPPLLVGFPLFRVESAGNSPRRATPFFASPKKGGKKGDPASPVVRCADDSPALLASGGRRGTRRLRLLKQPRRKAPPAAALLGGSERAFCKHRAFAEAKVGFQREKQTPTSRIPRSFRRGSVLAESPFRPAEQRNGRRGSPARLFEPEGRVPRRPPGVSSAGESFAQANDRGGGSPFLLTSLAKQRSESPAGAKSRPIQRKTTENRPAKAQAQASRWSSRSCRASSKATDEKKGRQAPPQRLPAGAPLEPPP